MANGNKMVDGQIVEMTDAEQKEFESRDFSDATKLSMLRNQRNALLAETDYMALGDVTMSDAWKTYRQELRDITKTYQSMSDDGFTFPTKPS